ncbi:cytochrome d ubiquinol oxidase subunit II [Actinosynnema sp. NPDC020468]|uniref:cytochrome d ubiquinol oxidase subunit II n=1 Tax=Actinosynnema sp. NPDC020468 TaxID=3154488 RepID=UPI0033D59FAA
MEAFWVALLGLLVAGYFALAGFDYGVALVVRFTGRDEPARRRVLRAMTPYFLGNEVWLVAAVGVLFGAFPRLEGELLSGHHGAVVVLLVGLVLFTVAVQLRDGGWWDVPLIGGALLVSVSWGLLLADVLGGPGWLWAVGVTALFSLHGAVFLVWRLSGPLRARALRCARWLLAPVAVFAALTVPTTGPVPVPAFGWAAVLAVLLLGAAWVALRGEAFGWAFVATAAVCALPVLAVFGARDVVGSEVMAHAGTLAPLAWIALGVAPLVLVFQWATWRMSRAAR